mgnify:FL=1
MQNPSKDIVIPKENQDILKVFVQTMPTAVAMLDDQLRYIITSNQWFTETNLEKTDLVGKFHYDVVPDIPERWKETHRRCLKGEHIKCEEDVFIRSNGNTEYLRWEVLPWYKTSTVIGGIIIYAEHITERKIVEKKMEKMLTKLRKSNTELKQFAHMCAHDLTEPLRTITNYIHLVEEKVQTDDLQDIHNYLNIIRDGATYMRALVQGILNYSQMGLYKPNKALINLEKIIKNAQITFAKKIKEKNAILEWENLPEVYGDMTLLTQVMHNLISNALKFNTNERPTIKIIAEEQEDFWHLSVTDNGIGIDKKYHATIFNIFVRLHSKSKYPGSGIGLASSKKVIEDHGGEMGVKSSLNNGSTFWFTLPKK